MLNPVLRSKGIRYPELRNLYDLGARVTYPNLYRDMVAMVRDVRREYMDRGTDPLARRAVEFAVPGSYARAQITRLERVIFEHKTVPVGGDNLGKWRSIEFELIFRSMDIHNQFVSYVRSKGYSKYVTVKDDGSLRADKPGEITKEVVVSYKTGNEQVVRDICEWLCHNKGERSYVNKTCGAHVHFDMRHVTEKEVELYGQRVARCVPALRSLLPKSRRENTYCLQPISNRDRYAFVNLTSYGRHQTLEIRGHSGTINADKILNWIKICETIMTTRIRSKAAELTTAQELIKHFDFDKSLCDYIARRAKQFSGEVVNAEETLDEHEAVPVTAHAPAAVRIAAAVDAIPHGAARVTLEGILRDIQQQT